MMIKSPTELKELIDSADAIRKKIPIAGWDDVVEAIFEEFLRLSEEDIAILKKCESVLDEISMAREAIEEDMEDGLLRSMLQKCELEQSIIQLYEEYLESGTSPSVK